MYYECYIKNQHAQSVDYVVGYVLDTEGPKKMHKTQTMLWED